MPAGGFQREQRLVGDAAVGEGGERAALWLPRADRGYESDPGLLGEILALAARWQSQLPHHTLDERLVAAQELPLGAGSPPRAASINHEACATCDGRITDSVMSAHAESAARVFFRGPRAADQPALWRAQTDVGAVGITRASRTIRRRWMTRDAALRPRGLPGGPHDGAIDARRSTYRAPVQPRSADVCDRSVPIQQRPCTNRAQAAISPRWARVGCEHGPRDPHGRHRHSARADRGVGVVGRHARRARDAHQALATSASWCAATPALAVGGTRAAGEASPASPAGPPSGVAAPGEFAATCASRVDADATRYRGGSAERSRPHGRTPPPRPAEPTPELA